MKPAQLVTFWAAVVLLARLVSRTMGARLAELAQGVSTEACFWSAAVVAVAWLLSAPLARR